MKRTGSLNHVFRLIWSEVLGCWIAVSEITRGRGKGTSRKLTRLAAALAAATAALAVPLELAQASPLGGQVTVGTGGIVQSGSTTTINQTSQNLSLGWKSFNVGAPETVNFVQPSASAIAVNRIADTNASQILGNLNANGQVFLINPNGIVFGQGAQVNVGGLVASTLDTADASLNNATRSFSGAGTGSIVNKGTLTAANGGYIALLGQNVRNQGVITAQLGSVVMGAGSAATLTFQGTGLASLKIDQSVLETLVDNGGLLQADGGMVIMNAGAQHALLASVVNNTGVIEARTLAEHNGTITLLGSMSAGVVNVGGTLDASAPNGGNGGFIETSAARVKVADGGTITTLAASGKPGTWLIDPTDYTIAASGGDMSGMTLSASLANGDVTIQSTTGGASGSGDVTVNDTVTWSANQLTLNAQNNININASMNGSGTAQLAFLYGQSTSSTDYTNLASYNVRAPVNLPMGQNFSTLKGNTGQPIIYTVVSTLGTQGSKTGTDLQGMKESANYVLGANIDASATANWTNTSGSGIGFLPIVSSRGFVFDGLGHTITALTSNWPGMNNVGLFGMADGTIQNVGLVNARITGNSNVGTLVGSGSFSTNINNDYASGTTVSGNSSNVGGLIGTTGGPINNSYFVGDVSSSGSCVGGLVGSTDQTYSKIVNSYAAGTVTTYGNNYVGGLIGSNNMITISNSYATSTVTANNGGNNIGGLTGQNSGTIENSYATGSVKALLSTSVGGLVGANWGSISRSYASGEVSGKDQIGGLTGSAQSQSSRSISSSYATGNVTGTGNSVGGLVGLNTGNAISNDYATGAVTGASSATIQNDVGGLIGTNSASINNSYATGNVSGSGNIGGLVGNGKGYGGISYSYATGNVQGLSGSGHFGGLLGSRDSQSYGSIMASYATGSVTGTGIINGQAVAVLTTAQIQSQASFNGWDFLDTWVMYEGHTAPLLRSLMTAVTVTGATKVYDGLVFNSATGVTYSKPVDNTLIKGTLTYGDAVNAGTYILTPAGLYSSQQGYIISYVSAPLTITPAPVVATALSMTGTRAYDGTNIVAAGIFTLSGLVNGDTLTLTGSGTVADKNVGDAKPVTLGTLTLGNGNGTGLASNYTFKGGTQTANITQLDSVIWTGGTTGNWSLASNWAGSAIPDLANVANVTIPKGTTVTFDDSVGGLKGAHLTSISGGNLIVNSGTLAVTQALAPDGFAQSGGTVNADSLTTSTSFNQMGGRIDVHGLTAIITTTGVTTADKRISNLNTDKPIVHASGRMIKVQAQAADNTPPDETAADTVISNLNTGKLTVSAVGNVSLGNIVSADTVSVSGNNIAVVAPVTWTTGVMSLSAQGNMDISAPLTGTSATAGLAINYGLGTTASANTASYNLKAGTAINLLAGQNFSTSQGSDAVFTPYTVIGAGPQAIAALQSMGTNLTGYFMLGSDVNAADTINWNNGAGFTPIGNATTGFTGTFDGMGHTIANLTINLPGVANTGMFAFAGTGSVIKNIGLVGGSITGGAGSGALVGNNGTGTLINSFATTNVSGGGAGSGGLVGSNTSGTISNSYATGTVNGGAGSGGLLGSNLTGIISNSHATGSVTGGAGAGGLVGSNISGLIDHSYATGLVAGGAGSGGLLGSNTSGTISNSYATGVVSGAAGSGGLVGSSTSGAISNSYATGNVTGAAGTGGLVGSNTSGSISNSSATGNVIGAAGTGGLVGSNTSGSITNDYSTGTVVGAAGTGGLLGSSTSGIVINSYWNTTTSNMATSVGGDGKTTEQLSALIPAMQVSEAPH